ncbi:hypothetical protein GCM10023350_28110 [Nocardioides endophyticus]|uniref:Uncharacterized protein n=1 Tax=Nocardioides endophyticus TaxID=1353775 RepID=A0ABP8Z0D1_9ACTN
MLLTVKSHQTEAALDDLEAGDVSTPTCERVLRAALARACVDGTDPVDDPRWLSLAGVRV